MEGGDALMIWVFVLTFVAGVIFPPLALPVGAIAAVIWLRNKYSTGHKPGDERD